MEPHVSPTPISCARIGSHAPGRPRFGAAAKFSAPEGFGSVHDARREEDHELAARVARAAVLEEKPEQRNIAEEGHLIEVTAGIPCVDAADDGGVAVHDEEIGLGL